MSHSVLTASRGPYPHAKVSPFSAHVRSSIDALRASATSNAEGFGQHSALIALGRLVHAEEGRFLEAVLRQLVAAEQRFHLIEAAVALPVYDEALSLVERNEAVQLEGLAVDPERRARHTYRPDLVVIDKESRAAFVLDVKRSLETWSGTASLEKLAGRMLAASLTLPDLLYREHRRLYVSHTSIAIIDLAESRDHYPLGVFPLGALDRLLGCEGLADRMAQARQAFRDAVADLVDELAPGAARPAVDAFRRDEPAPSSLPHSETMSQDVTAPDDPPGRIPRRPTFGIAAPAAGRA